MDKKKMIIIIVLCILVLITLFNIFYKKKVKNEIVANKIYKNHDITSVYDEENGINIYQLKDETGNIIHESQNEDGFKIYEENPNYNPGVDGISSSENEDAY